MDKRTFLKSAVALAAVTAMPGSVWSLAKNKHQLRVAQIGVGNMGAADLEAISKHSMVEIVALCDVDSKYLADAKKLHPAAKTYADYRVMFEEMSEGIDAVVVSTPDHTHAPASIMAMEKGKAVYCQKPLTHLVSEARVMRKIAEDKNLVTQMGIQVHSFHDYKLATLLIRDGIIGKVKSVHAWSPKNWGYDGTLSKDVDPIPDTLDWNLWLGTAEERSYKKGFYHPMNWRKLLDFGCGTLGDMGVHIFDTPYNALELDVPKTIKNKCRKPNGVGFPEQNEVTYIFPGTKYTTEEMSWHWYDGKGAPKKHKDLMLPNNEKLPNQGAMFVGEKGRLLLPHFMLLPRHIVNGEYLDLDLSKYATLGEPVSDYDKDSLKHYHEFVDACLGKGKCSAPFSYASRLTETILLGVIAGRFPNKTLHWDSKNGKFLEEEVNVFLDNPYRKF